MIAAALGVALARPAAALSLYPDSIPFSEPSLGVEGRIGVRVFSTGLLPSAIVTHGTVGSDDISIGFQLTLETGNADVLSVSVFPLLTWAGLFVEPRIGPTAWGTVPGTGVDIDTQRPASTFDSPIAPGEVSDLFFVSLDPETLHHIVSLSFVVELDAEFCTSSYPPYSEECLPSTFVSTNSRLVPEPHAASLVAAGFVLLTGWRRLTRACS
jgi:hypothetical protein